MGNDVNATFMKLWESIGKSDGQKDSDTIQALIDAVEKEEPQTVGKDDIGNISEKPIEDQLPKTFESINKVIDELVAMMKNEDIQRQGLLLYFKIFLSCISFIPILICAILNYLGYLQGYEMLAAIIAIPVETLGVFYVISKNLFGNDYRNKIPAMIQKIYESILFFRKAEEKDKNKSEKLH